MSSNFDFLKDVDSELYELIEDAQKLFLDEYFSQCAIQIRIFGETLAKKLSNNKINGTFDDILNTLKDNANSESEKELINDLFFIKQNGNSCAHGKNISASDTLKVIETAFEAAVNYAYSITKDEKINKLLFDTNLLIVQNKKDKTLVDKYVELAQQQKKELEQNKKEELLNKKQNEFISKTKKPAIVNPKKEKIKQKIKQAKKNLKENINKQPKKTKKKKAKSKKINYKIILFYIFVVVSLFLILKMFCIF